MLWDTSNYRSKGGRGLEASSLVHNGKRFVVRFGINMDFSDLIVREDKGDGGTLKVPTAW